MENKLYSLADEFLKTVKESEETPDLVKFAAGQRATKNMISKKLQKDREHYNALRSSVDAKEKALKDLNEALDGDRKALNSRRSDVLKAYEVLKNMDLIDSNEVKYMADDIGYVKNKKLYRLDANEDGELSLIPYKKKSKDNKEVDVEVEELPEEENILTSLVD